MSQNVLQQKYTIGFSCLSLTFYSGWIIAWVGQVYLFRKLSDRRILVKYNIWFPFFIYIFLNKYNKVQMMSTPQREDWDHRSSQTQAGYLVQLFRNLFYQKEMKVRSEAFKTLQIKIKYCSCAPENHPNQPSWLWLLGNLPSNDKCNFPSCC